MASRPLPAGPEDPLEGAQTLKPLTLRYVVAIDPDEALDPYEIVDRAFTPLQVVTAEGRGDLPASGSWLTVRGATVDAVLPTAGDGTDGGLVVRVHEAHGRHGALTIEGRTGALIDLCGAEVDRFDGHVALRPHQIVTVRLDPAT
jgi:hypothetical protein